MEASLGCMQSTKMPVGTADSKIPLNDKVSGTNGPE